MDEMTLVRQLLDEPPPPPEVVANFLADEADAALRRSSPLVWAATRSRGLFRLKPAAASFLEPVPAPAQSRRGTMQEKTMRLLRRRVFDRFGRGG